MGKYITAKYFTHLNGIRKFFMKVPQNILDKRKKKKSDICLFIAMKNVKKSKR